MAEMDPEVGRLLLEILKKGLEDPNSLTDADKAFLWARREYVGQKHKDRLPNVFSEEAEQEIQAKEQAVKEERQEKDLNDANTFDGQKDPTILEDVDESLLDDDEDDQALG